MLLVLSLVGTAVLAAIALVGARGWRTAALNGCEEDVVQKYRLAFYRAAGLAVIVGTLAAFSGTPAGNNPASKAQHPTKEGSRHLNSGIS